MLISPQFAGFVSLAINVDVSTDSIEGGCEAGGMVRLRVGAKSCVAEATRKPCASLIVAEDDISVTKEIRTTLI